MDVGALLEARRATTYATPEQDERNPFCFAVTSQEGDEAEQSWPIAGEYESRRGWMIDWSEPDWPMDEPWPIYDEYDSDWSSYTSDYVSKSPHTPEHRRSEFGESDSENEVAEPPPCEEAILAH